MSGRSNFWGIRDNPELYNMTEINSYTKDTFNDGNKFFLVLNLPNGTFQIFDNDHTKLAEATDLKGKKVVPFVYFYYRKTALTLIE